MHDTVNELGQPVGYPITDFISPPPPKFHELCGNFVRVEQISNKHFSSLYSAFSLDTHGGNWTYLPYGPFTSEEEFAAWATKSCFQDDPKFYAIIKNEAAAGLVSYLRITPEVGCIEIGHIHLSSLLQRTAAGTEALILMIEWAFEAGYRRVEWKSDALNAPSRRAAQRLGFVYEGTFRQMAIYKSRNRDTAWYAVTSQEWPMLKKTYEAWLHPSNFTEEGRQIKKLFQHDESLSRVGNS